MKVLVLLSSSLLPLLDGLLVRMRVMSVLNANRAGGGDSNWEKSLADTIFPDAIFFIETLVEWDPQMGYENVEL